MLFDPRKSFTPDPPVDVCLRCDGFGSDSDGNDCTTCDGEGRTPRASHGVECFCDRCGNGYWVVTDADHARDAKDVEHFEDLQAAIIRCVELAVITTEPRQVRAAPATEVDGGVRIYLWSKDAPAFEHDGDASDFAKGTYRSEQ